ncbi:NAD-dependent epimerase/dehydratase family protein [Leptolyngbya sp. NIES-2104]|uniref:NAD-dependent epimerase/dehydratase family protein n=1 Tax=Leptolyngbya sp. NIES-2104 TaxID=1552121 RepID=UPI0009E885E6|nr:NAD(P)-dependent oxidoreductase [Leptolyngbya sp. NIES-2104]
MSALSIPFSGAKVLVTGASGFIGHHLCQKLQQYQTEIYGVSRVQRESDSIIQWLQGDVASFDDMRRIIIQVKPDVIFHLAGHVTGTRGIDTVVSTLQGNLVSTVNLLTLMAEFGGRRIVLVGSLEEPDAGEDSIPSSPYAAAKWASSAYAQMFQHLYQLPIVRTRPFLVYGPAQMDFKKLIPHVTLSLLKGEAPQIGSGQRQIDWIYVEDVVEGLIAAAQTPGVEGEVFELGSGTLTSISSVVQRINQLVDPSIRPLFGALPDRPMEQVRTANIEASAQKLGWQPKISLDQGLAKTVEWYSSYYSDLVCCRR